MASESTALKPATLGSLRRGATRRCSRALRQRRDPLEPAPQARSPRAALPRRSRLRGNRAAANRQRHPGAPQFHPARPARPGQEPHPARPGRLSSTPKFPTSPAARFTIIRCARSAAPAASWSPSAATTRRSPGCRAKTATSKSWPRRTSPSPTSSATWTPSRPRAAAATFPHELTIHYGLLPRANRGIFAINELPDLAGKIQVGLFNIMQEGDVQIKGYPIRLPLDVLLVFTANPEDYTARGKIVTPLKDRIGSEIRTHYPATVEEGMAITAQEAWTERDSGRRDRSCPTTSAKSSSRSPSSRAKTSASTSAPASASACPSPASKPSSAAPNSAPRAIARPRRRRAHRRRLRRHPRHDRQARTRIRGRAEGRRYHRARADSRRRRQGVHQASGRRQPSARGAVV